MSFVLAMVLYPDVYKKLQAEMDQVVGRDRLPVLNDKDTLPYLSAVVTELYRYVFAAVSKSIVFYF
jgi:cytochrome P450